MSPKRVGFLTYPGSPLSHWAEGPAGTELMLSLADGSTRKLTLADYF